ncbi:hypothetical protein ACHAXH_009156 [Discostella pseudostelligera]
MAAFVASLPPTTTTQPNPTTFCLWKGSRRRTHGGGGGGCSFTSTARHALSDIYLRDESSWSSSLMTASSSSFSMADVKSWGQTYLQRDLVLWLLTTTTVPSDDTTQTTIPYFNTMNDDGATTQLQRSPASILLSSSSSASTAYRSLTQSEISLLQKAFASYYDNSNKNVEQSKELLGECISIWTSTSQSGDEIAALYRVRGDVNMAYPTRPRLTTPPPFTIWKVRMDTRPIRSQMMMQKMGRQSDVPIVAQMMQASKDYEVYFTATSRLDDEVIENESEKKEGNSVVAFTKDGTSNNKRGVDSTRLFSSVIKDGIQRNPYAAWEWGMVYRSLHMYNKAAEMHRLAALAFEEIGDNARSVICALDRGIDLACGLTEDNNVMGKGKSSNEAGRRISMVKEVLEDAISSDVDVGGRDVELLQRLVAKEGEARVVLSGVLWSLDQSNGSKAAAEAQFGTCCTRLDELNADYRARMGKTSTSNNGKTSKSISGSVGFSIDDIVGADEASCSRFKNDNFIEEKLVWNDGMKILVKRFLSLSH